MIKAGQTKTFGGNRYKLSIGGHGRKFTREQAQRHANTARKAGYKARVVSLGKNGWAVYKRR